MSVLKNDCCNQVTAFYVIFNIVFKRLFFFPFPPSDATRTLEQQRDCNLNPTRPYMIACIKLSMCPSHLAPQVQANQSFPPSADSPGCQYNAAFVRIP